MLLLCVKSMKPLYTWNKIQTHWWPSRPYGIWSLPCSPVSPQYAFCTLVTLGFVLSFLLKWLTPLSHAMIPPDHCISPVHPSDLTLPSTFLAFRLKNLRAPCSSHCSWNLISICVTVDGLLFPWITSSTKVKNLIAPGTEWASITSECMNVTSLITCQFYLRWILETWHIF